MPYPTQWANYDPQKFMCCDCFKILDISECGIDTDGETIDVCVECLDLDINTTHLYICDYLEIMKKKSEEVVFPSTS